jgi:hypothetical protein
MYWRSISLSLASKQAIHPLTKAILVAISMSPPKWPPYSSRCIEIEDSSEMCSVFVGLCCLYPCNAKTNDIESDLGPDGEPSVTAAKKTCFPRPIE